MTLLSRQLPDFRQLRNGAAQIEFSAGRVYFPSHLSIEAAESRVAAEHVNRVIQAITEWSTLAGPPHFDVLIDERLHTPLAHVDAKVPFVVLPCSSISTLGVPGELQPDLVHEVAHLFLYPGRSPFFAEGWAVACSYALSLATYFPFPLGSERSTLHAAVAARAEGDWTLGDYLLGGSRHADFTIQQMPSELNRLAYARAGSFVQHLITQRGAAAFVRMVEAFNAEPTMDEDAALRAHFGESLGELEAGWRMRCGIPQKASGATRIIGGSVEERARSFAIGGIEGWTLWTDQVIGGNTSAMLAPEDDGFIIEGRLGNRGPFQFAGAQRFLYGKPTPEQLAPCKGLRFQARGDGKNYQICISTEAAWEPGKEFIYLLSTLDEWTFHEIPLGHFSRFIAGDERLRGDHIVSLHMRAFGYRNQSVRLALRHIELYL